jgi:hypothetical protein
MPRVALWPEVTSGSRSPGVACGRGVPTSFEQGAAMTRDRGRADRNMSGRVRCDPRPPPDLDVPGILGGFKGEPAAIYYLPTSLRGLNVRSRGSIPTPSIAPSSPTIFPSDTPNSRAEAHPQGRTRYLILTGIFINYRVFLQRRISHFHAPPNAPFFSLTLNSLLLRYYETRGITNICRLWQSN